MRARGAKYGLDKDAWILFAKGLNEKAREFMQTRCDGHSYRSIETVVRGLSFRIITAILAALAKQSECADDHERAKTGRYTRHGESPEDIGLA